MQIQISWLLQKPADLDLHCLQRQGISGFSRTRVNGHYYKTLHNGQNDYLLQPLFWLVGLRDYMSKENVCEHIFFTFRNKAANVLVCLEIYTELVKFFVNQQRTSVKGHSWGLKKNE